jgi:hypothetical protein
MLRPSTGYLIKGSKTGDHVASTREKKKANRNLVRKSGGKKSFGRSTCRGQDIKLDVTIRIEACRLDWSCFG